MDISNINTALGKELTRRGAIAMVVLYAVPAADGMTLDFLTSDEYENGDSILKSDVKSAVQKIADTL